MLKFHPDRRNNSPDKKIFEEKAKEINDAYKIIMNYCIKYPISSDMDKVKDLKVRKYLKDHLRSFYYGWISDKD